MYARRHARTQEQLNFIDIKQVFRLVKILY